MDYDFEKIGKQSVFNQLTEGIANKADYLQAATIGKDKKLEALKDIEKMAKDAYKILSEL